MAKPPSRDLLKIIFTNFINSFKPRQIRGNLMGEDYFGNKYFEIPANPSIGKRKPSRWFEPKDKEAFDQELTAEWESWLRYRRDDPPTKEELVRNFQMMELTKRNAAELKDKFAKPQDEKDLPKQGRGPESFPKYDEYEIMPGEDPTKRRHND